MFQQKYVLLFDHRHSKLLVTENQFCTTPNAYFVLHTLQVHYTYSTELLSLLSCYPATKHAQQITKQT